MVERPYRDKDWLLEHYYEKDMPLTEIAELEESCNRRGLHTWMERNGIQRIQNPQLPYESLVEQYKSGKSIHELGDKYGVDGGTISKRLKYMGCEPNNSGPTQTHVTLSYRHDHGLYMRWVDETGECFVHQLLAIAEGADVDKVFSKGEYQVHHKNGISWDNRSENIELLTAEEHGTKH